MSRSDLVDIEVHLRKETTKAWLVVYEDEENPVWLPKSEIEVQQDTPRPGVATVTMSEWLAQEKGLI